MKNIKNTIDLVKFDKDNYKMLTYLQRSPVGYFVRQGF